MSSSYSYQIFKHHPPVPCTLEPTSDDPPFNWHSTSVNERVFFSRADRNTPVYKAEPRGKHVGHSMKAFMFRSLEPGSQLTLEHGHGPEAGLIGDSGNSTKMFSIVDEMTLVGGYHEHLIFKNGPWIPSISANGDRMTFTPDYSKWTHDLYACATQSHLTRKLRQLVFERSGLTHPGRPGGPSTTSSLPSAEHEVVRGHLFYIWEEVDGEQIVRMPSDPDRYYLKPVQMNLGYHTVETSRLLEDAPFHGDAQKGQEEVSTAGLDMYLFHPPSNNGSEQLVKRDGPMPSGASPRSGSQQSISRALAASSSSSDARDAQSRYTDTDVSYESMMERIRRKYEEGKLG
ncbi:hypothetical protein L486_04596 [Kwoniella mangroviensis CBS 10435]|uniref:Uncharacterized protein n=1 Tax=Kwoniella mangroviensis CBS 10435 TaxID=1331196 RepID=A0A1B9ISP8_9TREE|nr:hypothetical protein L486_04596 [Kwoniella mangroviensis CBS 10435]